MHRHTLESGAATHLRPLATQQELDAAVARSFERPVIIFKHSSTCGTSVHARHEILALVSDPALAADVYQVHVQTGRTLCNAVSARFGLRHESPQVLLIRDGALKWHASHFRVTADVMSAALASHGGAPR